MRGALWEEHDPSLAQTQLTFLAKQEEHTLMLPLNIY